MLGKDFIEEGHDDRPSQDLWIEWETKNGGC